MENDSSLQKLKPIEVTTHNLYFHEDSPILSTDFYNDIVATCGFDNAVRFWTPKFSEMKYRDNTYKTAINSSIQFEFLMEFAEFSKPINCVRFLKKHEGNSFRFILAACCDGGKVVVITDKESFIVANDTKDDAYEICWCGYKLLVGYASGKIEVYQMTFQKEKINNPEIIEVYKENSVNQNSNNSDMASSFQNEFSKIQNNKNEFNNSLSFELIFNQKIHTGTIQGIAFNDKYNLIATHSLDKTVKVHRLMDSNFELISIFDQKIDNSRGLFKRLLFDGDSLYIFTKNNIVNVISYPFKPIHLYKKIGPLNSTPVKIVKGNHKDNELLYICTKKSVYILNNDNLVCIVDNCCYMAITDAFSQKDTLFVSSLDGFLATVRMT